MRRARQCPACAFTAGSRKALWQHMQVQHPKHPFTRYLDEKRYGSKATATKEQ